MAFDIYLGNVNKRINSTFQADFSAWVKTQAVWKDAKDLDSPVVTVTRQNLLLDYGDYFRPRRSMEDRRRRGCTSNVPGSDPGDRLLYHVRV